MSARRFAVIVNPRGGRRRGLKVLKRVEPLLHASGAQLDVCVTECPGHAARIAGSLDLGALDGICVVGGDGTVHEVADGLMHRNEPIGVPLGLVPAGTGNTLHQHLKCDDPLEAARRIVAGGTLPLDVIRVTLDDRVLHCVDIVGWGAVADINGTAERLRLLGRPRYAVAAVWHIARAKRRRARLVLDERRDDDEFLFVIACNAKFTGAGMKLAPQAEVGDGKIDVVVLRRASRRQMLTLFTKVFDGSHLELGYVEYHQVRSFAVESDGCEPLDLDGEMKGHAPFRAEVLPAALRVFGGMKDEG
jgi:YegS/Rv2252/BmrU family lipid kinase